MSARFSSEADFLTVYISEAHPREEANFAGNIVIAEHKVREERRGKKMLMIRRIVELRGEVGGQ